MSRALLDLLLKEKLISPETHQEVTDSPEASIDPVRPLVRREIVSEGKLTQFLSQKFGIPSINLGKLEIGSELISKVPPEIAKKYEAIPVKLIGTKLVLAVADPVDQARFEDLKAALDQDIEFALTPFSALDAALVKYYGAHSLVKMITSNFGRVVKQRGEPAPNEVGEIFEIGVKLDLVQQPIVSLANAIFEEAILRGASDIHIEPFDEVVRVRMRVDGQLRESLELPPDLKKPLVSRLKVMAKLDISDSQHPQDGRIRMVFRGLRVDFRLNTLPSFFGEKVVMRCMAQLPKDFNLTKIGLLPDQLESIRRAIHAPNGLVLVTGPTGSGKTTTLYAALHELNTRTDSISTVEDPVEMNLPGIVQTQVNRETNLTFATILRSLLRQDPDVLLIGEIRDHETAEIAVQAAMTGHLVLSTLHTNDAPSAVLRLANMKIESFMTVGSLSCVISQRLVRKICPNCKVPAEIPDQLLQNIGLRPENKAQYKFSQGTGCIQCDQTGYRGRLGVYEVFNFSPALKEAVLKGVSVLDLRKLAKAEGMKSLRQVALERAASGDTTLEEAISVSLQN